LLLTNLASRKSIADTSVTKSSEQSISICSMMWFSRTVNRTQRSPTNVHSPINQFYLPAKQKQDLKVLHFQIETNCSFTKITQAHLWLYIETSATDKPIFNNKKTIDDHNGPPFTSASITFETNTWINHWKRFGTMSSVLSGGSPRQHWKP
jgi:hypothetical protein